MAKICTSEKTAARQRWIEKGLMDLMQKKRFEEISVTDLCRHLELSRRSFYRYFHDLEDVLDSLLTHTFQDMSITSSSMSLTALERDYEFWFHRKDLLSALANSGMHSKMVQHALKYADEETLNRYLSAQDREMNLSREMNLFVISGLSSLLLSWHAEGFQKSPGEMARISRQMLSKLFLSDAEHSSACTKQAD